MKPALRLALAGCALLLGVIVWQSPFRLVEYQRVSSPDGCFYAVAGYHAWRSYLPGSPGAGGDKPGYVTVFTREGRSYGKAPLGFVSMIGDLQWSPDRAELPGVGAWDLVEHRLLD